METQAQHEGKSGLGGRRRKNLLRQLNLASDYRFNYKETDVLNHFMSERGKICPRRLTGLSATLQRQLATEVKRARALALMPFVTNS